MSDDPSESAETVFPSNADPSRAGPGASPFAVAAAWLRDAESAEINDPNAMALATADADGQPDVRMVLLKEIEHAPGAPMDGAFLFYTNLESAKAADLATNPRAALVLHWKSLRRQIRVRGAVSPVEPEKADAYYASRSYQSRIGAWASRQSRPLSSRAALMAEAALYAARYPAGPPRPPHWGGYRVTPVAIEFWSDGAHRLHDRFLWTRDDDGATWRATRLNP